MSQSRRRLQDPAGVERGDLSVFVDVEGEVDGDLADRHAQRRQGVEARDPIVSVRVALRRTRGHGEESVADPEVRRTIAVGPGGGGHGAAERGDVACDADDVELEIDQITVPAQAPAVGQAETDGARRLEVDVEDGFEANAPGRNPVALSKAVS